MTYVMSMRMYVNIGGKEKDVIKYVRDIFGCKYVTKISIKE